MNGFKFNSLRTFSRLTALALGFTFLAACTPESSSVKPISVTSGDRLFQTKNIASFGLAGTKKVVLTIDDGPYPKVTPRLLDLLSRLKIRATFFMVGAQARKYPELVARIQEEGHIVANHSYSHANLQLGLYKESPEMLIDEVMNTHRAISPFMNSEHRMYFRAPYAAWQQANAKPLNQIASIRDYIGPVGWDIGSRVSFDEAGRIRTGADWECWSKKLDPRTCAEGYYREILSKKGGVILMHDLKVQSAEMAELLLPALLAKGYQFINLDDIGELEKYQYEMY